MALQYRCRIEGRSLLNRLGKAFDLLRMPTKHPSDAVSRKRNAEARALHHQGDNTYTETHRGWRAWLRFLERHKAVHM